jgi:peptidyl-prolyl cis-trans isomerase SurA
MAINMIRLWLALGLLAVAPSRLAATIVEQVVVAIDGEPYTLSNLKDYAESKMKREFPKGDLNKIEDEDKEVLEQFITEKLVTAEVKRLGISLSDQEIDQYIDEIKKKNDLSDEDLTEALRREGLTREQYRESVRAELEKSQIIRREVQEKVSITDEDVERYYQQNKKKFLTRERFHLRHILLSLSKDSTPEQQKEVMQKALQIRAQLVAGADFAQLAKQYSEGSGANDGGDLGWTNRGTLLQEIEAAATKLSVGEVSQPVRTDMGLHLIKLEGKEGGEPLPLPEVAGKIKEELYAKTMEERFQKWLKTDLRKKYRVDVKLPGVVFRPEESKEVTLNKLMASSTRKTKQEKPGFLSYLNPFSYIVKETPIEDENGEETNTKIMSIFGLPLFKKDGDGEVPPDPLAAPEPKKEPTESKGFFSSLNPF